MGFFLILILTASVLYLGINAQEVEEGSNNFVGENSITKGNVTTFDGSGIRISFPSNWTSIPQEDDVNIALRTSDGSGFLSVFVMPQKSVMPSTVSLDQHSEQIIRSRTNSTIDALSLVGRQAVTLSGIPGTMAVFTGLSNSSMDLNPQGKIYIISLWTAKNNKFIMADYITSSSKPLESLPPDIQKVLDSLEISN